MAYRDARAEAARLKKEVEQYKTEANEYKAQLDHCQLELSRALAELATYKGDERSSGDNPRPSSQPPVPRHISGLESSRGSSRGSLSSFDDFATPALPRSTPLATPALPRSTPLATPALPRSTPPPIRNSISGPPPLPIRNSVSAPPPKPIRPASRSTPPPPRPSVGGSSMGSSMASIHGDSDDDDDDEAGNFSHLGGNDDGSGRRHTMLPGSGGGGLLPSSFMQGQHDTNDIDEDDEDEGSEGHAGNLEYTIKKWTKTGQRQGRIIVLQPAEMMFALLTSDRKPRKEYQLQSISGVHIPKDDSEEHFLCTLSFQTFNNQRPFKVGFTDPFDRMHFVSELSLLHNKVEIRDDSPFMDEAQVLRFSITKINRANKTNKRILAVHSKKRVITYKRGTKVKELLLKHVVKIERALDKKTARLYFQDRTPAHFIFEDPGQREKFLGRVLLLWDIEKGDQKAIEHLKLHGPYPAVNSSPLGHEQDITIFATSWNVGGAPKPKKAILQSWLGQPGTHAIYIVGFQECSKKRPAWCSAVKTYCESRAGGEKYVAVSTVRLWDMMLLILARDSIAGYINHVKADTIPCGIADMLGNKGGVGVSFTVRDTSFCVVTCHLAARAERLAQRQANFMRIVHSLNLGLKGYDILNESHHVIWLGDFNYRIDHDFHQVCKLVEEKQWAKLVPYDQLTNEKAANNVFWGFSEGVLDFGPTYRWDKKTPVVSNKREQPPSWTDRILWKSIPGAEVEFKCLQYSSSPEAYGSDHRPVWAVYSVALRRPYMGRNLYHTSKHNARSYHHLNIQLTACTLRLVPGNTTKTSDLSLLLATPIVDPSMHFSNALEYIKDETWKSKPDAHFTLRPFVSDEQFISTASILISIQEDNAKEDTQTWSKDGPGCAVLSLAQASVNDTEFCATINKNGLPVGQLTGHLQLVWEGTIKSKKLSSARSPQQSMAKPPPGLLRQQRGEGALIRDLKAFWQEK